MCWSKTSVGDDRTRVARSTGYDEVHSKSIPSGLRQEVACNDEGEDLHCSMMAPIRCDPSIGLCLKDRRQWLFYFMVNLSCESKEASAVSWLRRDGGEHSQCHCCFRCFCVDWPRGNSTRRCVMPSWCVSSVCAAKLVCVAEFLRMYVVSGSYCSPPKEVLILVARPRILSRLAGFWLLLLVAGGGWW